MIIPNSNFSKTQMKYPIILNLALALLILIACSGCNLRSDAPVYGTVPVSRGNIEQHITASGTLSAVVSVDVGSQVSGLISELKVDFNSTVKKGQLIAQIDPSAYIAALAQAEGDLASAKATVVLKKQILERTKILAPQRAASQLDLDQANADLAQAEASVLVKQAVVESARTNLGYCKITSPSDGIVISRKVTVGQTLAAAMTTPILFTIAQDITKMNISASVSEADIGQVKERQSVDFTVDAFPEETFKGIVSQVRQSPTTTQNVVTYETIITLDNPERKLFPGMTANVSILVAERKNILKIQNAALRYTPPENAVFVRAPPAKLERGQRLVYTLGTKGKLNPIVIKVGITDGVDTEVLSGLSDSLPVISSTLTNTSKSSVFAPSGSPPPNQ